VSTARENMKTMGCPTPTTMPGVGKTVAVIMCAGPTVAKVAEPVAVNPFIPATL
jgi:hypothetical protein